MLAKDQKGIADLCAQETPLSWAALHVQAQSEPLGHEPLCLHLHGWPGTHSKLPSPVLCAGITDARLVLSSCSPAHAV